LVDAVVKGQTVPLRLTLVGRALDYYPYFVLSLEQLAQRGLGRDRIRFALSKIQCLRTGLVLTRDRGLPEASVFSINPLEKLHETSDITSFKIIMKTPLRLRKNGQRLFHFDFESFVGAVVRRIELMAKWHCELDLFFRFSHILESARGVHLISDESRFHDWLKFSKRQNQVMPVGGTIGEVTVEGNYGTFEGIFNAAHYLGAGNQTSFGLGQVEFAAADQ